MENFEKKREFTRQLEPVFKMALPNLKRLEFLTCEQLQAKGKGNMCVPGDEFVSATMEGGCEYIINVTCNSLMAMLGDVFDALEYK